MIETKAATSAIVGWWRTMQPGDRGGVRLPGDRGALARLRRAGTILNLCSLAETITLCRSLAARPDDLERIALIAGVMASVRTQTSEKLAGILGQPEKQPLMSHLRFRRLIETPDPESQLTGFRRALALSDHRANTADLADSLLDWTHPDRRDRRRQRWLYDYFGVMAPAAQPAAQPSTGPETPIKEPAT